MVSETLLSNFKIFTSIWIKSWNVSKNQKGKENIYGQSIRVVDTLSFGVKHSLCSNIQTSIESMNSNLNGTSFLRNGIKDSVVG
jgi:hypothetical protein